MDEPRACFIDRNPAALIDWPIAFDSAPAADRFAFSLFILHLSLNIPSKVRSHHNTNEYLRHTQHIFKTKRHMITILAWLTV